MTKPQTTATLGAIEYLHFNCHRMGCSIEVCFKELQDPQEVVAQDFIKVVQPVWQPAIDVLCAFSGHHSSNVVHGRVHTTYRKPENARGNVLVRINLEGLVSLVNEWKTYTALLHYRNWQLGRNVENDYVDIYFMPYQDDSVEWSPLAQGEAVLAQVTKLAKASQPSIGMLTALTLNEEHIDLITQVPIFCNDCVPIEGGDGYWIKMMVQ